ncbi:hypothetical protein Ancab_002759 [Ancistrocladus abbreviatus]
MAVEEGGGEGGGEETLPVSSRVKFYCSYGGKILPRPHDGILKYVGGETRVVAVSRKITFSELIEKVSNLFEGYLVLKYQIASEDLDALVSVKCEEDLRHMFEEYDRIESEGNSKLRTFLFPIKPTIIETAQNPFSVVVPQSLEQRFVDALNGVVRTTRPPFSMSRIKSVSSSPSESPSPQSNSPNGAALNPSMNSEASFINSLQTNVNLNLNLTRSSDSSSTFNDPVRVWQGNDESVTQITISHSIDGATLGTRLLLFMPVRWKWNFV